MKFSWKSIALALSLVLAVSMVALGTLAFLTDSETVTNTFTVGQVDIGLDESEVDENGDPIYPGGSNDDGTPVVPGEEPDRVETNDYHMIPGEEYVKDPMVTVMAGSEESYVRMIVVLNKYQELLEIFGNSFDPAEHVTGYDSEIWPCVSTTPDTTANTLTMEFRYHTTVSGTDEDLALEPLFETFTVPNWFDNDDLALLGNAVDADGNEIPDSAFVITVHGHAIQTATFQDSDNGTAEDAAWAAFDAQVGE